MNPRTADARPDEGRPRDETRARIVRVAVEILTRDGRDALTTRAVATAAGVQAPILYRLFGDKGGLLDAVAEHGFLAYMADKEGYEPSSDAATDLRRGWDIHVEFGLTHPAIYALMYADPRPGGRSPIAERAYGHLRAFMRRLAAAGRLRMGEERAANLVHAAACGTVLTLLAPPAGRADPGLSEATREAVLAAILTNAPAVDEPGPVAVAVALRARLPEATRLTPGERALMGEWLDRIAASRE